jgi:NAD-dependent SIR2 family protein deacetylase
MGLPLIIVNQGETPYDHLASKLIAEPIDEVIPKMVEEVIK